MSLHRYELGEWVQALHSSGDSLYFKWYKVGLSMRGARLVAGVAFYDPSRKFAMRLNYKEPRRDPWEKLDRNPGHGGLLVLGVTERNHIEVTHRSKQGFDLRLVRFMENDCRTAEFIHQNCHGDFRFFRVRNRLDMPELTDHVRIFELKHLCVNNNISSAS